MMTCSLLILLVMKKVRLLSQLASSPEILIQHNITLATVRKSLPARFSTSALTSTKILSQRSAVPAVLSRTTSTNAVDREKKRKLSSTEKDKLLRIAKRPRKGPFNSVMDPSDYKAGDGIVELSRAVKESSGYDPWAEGGEEEKEDEDEDEEDVTKPKKVKVGVSFY